MKWQIWYNIFGNYFIKLNHKKVEIHKKLIHIINTVYNKISYSKYNYYNKWPYYKVYIKHN